MEGRRQRRLALVLDGPPPAVDHFLPGLDLDGDGIREVLTAWFGPGDGGAGSILVLQALSGRDGRTLWGKRIPCVHRLAGGLRLSGAGPDGWPLLLVPLGSGGGGPPLAMTFTTGQGRLVSILPGAADPRATDLDYDGLPRPPLQPPG